MIQQQSIGLLRAIGSRMFIIRKKQRSEQKSIIKWKNKPFKPWIECAAQWPKIAIWLNILQIKYHNVEVMKYWWLGDQSLHQQIHRFNNIIYKFESRLLSRIHHAGRPSYANQEKNIDQHITQTKTAKNLPRTKNLQSNFPHCIVEIINLFISFFQVAIPIME